MYERMYLGSQSLVHCGMKGTDHGRI